MRPLRRKVARVIAGCLVALIAIPVVVAGLLWFTGPQLIAPVENFEQGPGGAVAYVSLLNQLRVQSRQRDVNLILKETEFNGMLSSALLSGKSDRNPLQKVRSTMHPGQIEVDTILDLSRIPGEQIPERFRVPMGLNLRLKPSVSTSGEASLLITSARIGRLPVPIDWVRWAGRHVTTNIPGFEPAAPSIELPIGQMISAQAGTSVRLKGVAIGDAAGGPAITLTVNRN